MTYIILRGEERGDEHSEKTQTGQKSPHFMDLEWKCSGWKALYWIVQTFLCEIDIRKKNNQTKIESQFEGIGF